MNLTNLVLMEDIDYWVAKCASLQQEVDVLNEKLANSSVIKWQTGIPNSSGRYLVTYRSLKTGEVNVNALDWFSIPGDWFGGKYLEVITWCKLSDIQPCIGEKVNKEKKP